MFGLYLRSVRRYFAPPMKNMFFLCMATCLLLAACSTEVDLSADYKPTTLVYSLLDPVADTQWVKINKTFVGDGNNLDYALIRDSSEYDFDDFVATIEELDVNENVVATWQLDSLTIHDKEINGIFYSPHQTVYYIETPGGLNQEHEYKLNIDFKIKNDVDAQTDVVKVEDVQMISPQQNSGANLILAQSVGTDSFEFKTYTIRFIPVESAPFYEVVVRFYYEEKLWSDMSHTVLVDSTLKYLDYYVGSFDETNISTSGHILANVSGESFFSFLANNIEANPLITREIGVFNPGAEPEAGTQCYDVIIHAGGDELNTYFMVNSPVTGIVQERPFYTNIGGGIGLFSSRSTFTVTGVFLNNQIPGSQPQVGVERAFIYSSYTQGLNFCNPNPSSQFYCGN